MIVAKDTTRDLLQQRKKCKSGMTVVESALVMSVAFLFLFGIFEYARFLFLLQISENAAREGARYAVVHTGDGTTQQNVIDQVTAKMAGRQNELSGYSVDVLNVVPSTGATIASSNWNDAPFGGAILVRVNGTYTPIMASFLKIPGSITLSATSMMSSEAN